MVACHKACLSLPRGEGAYGQSSPREACPELNEGVATGRIVEGRPRLCRGVGARPDPSRVLRRDAEKQGRRRGARTLLRELCFGHFRAKPPRGQAAAPDRALVSPPRGEGQGWGLLAEWGVQGIGRRTPIPNPLTLRVSFAAPLGKGLLSILPKGGLP